MKKNLGLELNRGLMNIAEELTNKKGIKMFYSLSDNYSSATEFFLDVKVSIHGFNKSTTCVVNTSEEATVVVENLVNELIIYKVKIDNEIIINDILKYANNKFEAMKNIVKEYSKHYEICIVYVGCNQVSLCDEVFSMQNEYDINILTQYIRLSFVCV